jgi:hypothetical protein
VVLILSFVNASLLTAQIEGAYGMRGLARVAIRPSIDGANQRGLWPYVAQCLQSIIAPSFGV